MYLTSVRIGIQSADARDWGEVDEFTGINVIAATQVIITLAFLGVIVLQVGQYWAEEEDKTTFQKAMEEDIQERAAAKEKNEQESSSEAGPQKVQSKASGSKKPKSASKRK